MLPWLGLLLLAGACLVVLLGIADTPAMRQRVERIWI